jgi:hypothetical protein
MNYANRERNNHDIPIKNNYETLLSQCSQKAMNIIEGSMSTKQI